MQTLLELLIATIVAAMFGGIVGNFAYDATKVIVFKITKWMKSKYRPIKNTEPI